MQELSVLSSNTPASAPSNTGDLLGSGVDDDVVIDVVSFSPFPVDLAQRTTHDLVRHNTAGSATADNDNPLAIAVRKKDISSSAGKPDEDEKIKTGTATENTDNTENKTENVNAAPFEICSRPLFDFAAYAGAGTVELELSSDPELGSHMAREGRTRLQTGMIVEMPKIYEVVSAASGALPSVEANQSESESQSPSGSAQADGENQNAHSHSSWVLRHPEKRFAEVRGLVSSTVNKVTAQMCHEAEFSTTTQTRTTAHQSYWDCLTYASQNDSDESSFSDTGIQGLSGAGFSLH